MMSITGLTGTYNLAIMDIAMQLRGALAGLVASQYKDQGEEYDIRVMAEDNSFDTPEELSNLPISSGNQDVFLATLFLRRWF